MDRPQHPGAAPDEADRPGDAPLDAEAAGSPSPDPRPSPDALVRGMSVAGISRRRVAFVVGALATAWILVVFARQVGEASAATARADVAAVQNGELTQEVAALQRELDLVQTTAFIAQQAHGYGLGSRGEVAFRLAPGAPALPPDAPGSAALRLGEPSTPRSPLESWLTVLFGSGR